LYITLKFNDESLTKLSLQIWKVVRRGKELETELLTIGDGRKVVWSVTVRNDMFPKPCASSKLGLQYVNLVHEQDQVRVFQMLVLDNHRPEIERILL